MSNVSRSVYQKLKEENKRLMKDIRILCEDGIPSFEQIMLIKKYRSQFKKEKEFNNMIKLACQNHIKNNPDDPAVKAYHEINEKIRIQQMEKEAKEHGCECLPECEIIGCAAGKYCYHCNVDPLGKVYRHKYN